MARSQKDREAVHQLVTQMGSEKHVVERVRDEMDARGWSQSEVSRRMDEEVAQSGHGGVLHQGVLSKLLRGDRGRHVSIDQLITLSRVFGVPLGELLLPADVLANVRGWRYLMEAGELQNEIRALRHRYNERIIDVRRMLDDSDELRRRVEEYRDALRGKAARELDEERWPEQTDDEREEFLRGNRYPVLIAAEDALMGDES